MFLVRSFGIVSAARVGHSKFTTLQQIVVLNAQHLLSNLSTHSRSNFEGIQA